jgi:hypothetical protein
LRGQSIVHPDVRTLAAFGALVVAVVVSTAIVLGAQGPKSPAARRP